jgi:hypothetical protein
MKLVERLIDLALEKARNRAQLETHYPDACSPTD